MELRRKYIELTIANWSDLFLLNQSFFSNFVFRGQGDESWPLETSIRRMVMDYHANALINTTPNFYERRMIDEFKWKYPGYQNNSNMMPKDEESIEWLSVMQHYGAKTRLLDFSDSLFVAVYMALYGATKTDSSVWALNKIVVREPFIRAYKEKGKHVSEEELNCTIYKEAEEWLRKDDLKVDDLDFKRLFMVRPRICNERISRQQGLFIIPSSIAIPFMEILKEYCDLDNAVITNVVDFGKMTQQSGFEGECGLIKITIPNSLRYDFTRALQQMNISAETMYPGLEGLAQSINCLREQQDGKTEGSIINIRQS